MPSPWPACGRIDAGGIAFENSEPIEEPLQSKQPLGMVVALQLTNT